MTGERKQNYGKARSKLRQSRENMGVIREVTGENGRDKGGLGGIYGRKREKTGKKRSS
jgi:hypothetical protein